MAEKYDIPGLEAKAATKFDAAIRDSILHDRISIVDEIVEAIPHTYSSTPDRDRRLRDRAIDIVLLYHRKVRVHPGLEELIATVPEFFEEARIKSSGFASTRARILGLDSIKESNLDG